MSNAIELTKTAGECLFRFNRPELRNPLSIFVVEELIELLNRILDDPTVKKVTFAGSGKSFASGADLKEIFAVGASEAPEFAKRGQQLMNIIAEMPQETTAYINGACYGGALDLALACDKRIASPDATFCHPGVGLGIITGWGGTQRLPRLVGETNAFKLFFSAEPIDANEALRIGLIDGIRE